MSDIWGLRPLGELAEIFDGPHATPKKTNQGPWFLSISSLVNGRLALAESAHISQAEFELWTRRVTPRTGDVLFSYETRLGEAALMPAGINACLGRRMGLLRPRPDVDSRFLLYAYLAPQFQGEIAKRQIHGATVDRIPLNELADWPIAVPDPPTQERIVTTLGAIDNQVEHNEKLALLLARLAHLDFNVTQARNVDDSTEGALEDLGRPSRELARGDEPYIGLDAMPRGSTVLTEWLLNDAPEGQATRFKSGDILFGKLRPYFKKVGVAPVDGRCSTEVLVLRPFEPDRWGPLLGYVSSDAFIEYCTQVSRGTKMPRAEWSDVSSYPVELLPPGEARALSFRMRACHDLATALVMENHALRRLRDAWLPALFAGDTGSPARNACVASDEA